MDAWKIIKSPKWHFPIFQWACCVALYSIRLVCNFDVVTQRKQIKQSKWWVHLLWAWTRIFALFSDSSETLIDVTDIVLLSSISIHGITHVIIDCAPHRNDAQCTFIKSSLTYRRRYLYSVGWTIEIQSIFRAEYKCNLLALTETSFVQKLHVSPIVFSTATIECNL